MSQLRYTILDCHRIERVFYRVLVVYFAYFKNCCLIIALNRTKLNRVELKTIMGRTNTNTSLHVHPKYAAGRKHGRLASITICSCVEYIYIYEHRLYIVVLSVDTNIQLPIRHFHIKLKINIKHKKKKDGDIRLQRDKHDDQII